MTVSELEAWFDGYDERQEFQMLMARTISFYAAAPHTKKLKKPKDLFSLPSDRKRKPAKPYELPSQEYFKAVKERAKQRHG